MRIECVFFAVVMFIWLIVSVQHFIISMMGAIATVIAAFIYAFYLTEMKHDDLD